MASAMLLSMLSAGVATADSVTPYGLDRVIIKFDEPVVSLGVVENAWSESLPAEDRGLNLFDLTGDAQHTPKARWVDQDALELTFVKGTSVATRYRLAFRPGSDHYLSGKKMPEPVFEFAPQALRLESVHTQSGIPGLAFLVVVEQQHMREAREFSDKAPVRYEFREMLGRKKGKMTYGRVVAGKISPAQFRHFSKYEQRELLRHLEDFGIANSEEALAGITPEMPLPGVVLVTPAEELSGQNEWRLYAIAEPNSGFADSELSADTVTTELSTGVQVDVGSEGENMPALLGGQVRFGAPIEESAVADIFRAMEIHAGEVSAVNSEDGKSKTLTVGGKTITFRLLPLPDNRDTAYLNGELLRADGSKIQDYTVWYDAPYTNEFNFAIDGVDELPITVDFVIKADTQAMLGLKTATDHRHRVTLNAAAPLLSFDNTPGSPMLMPLQGTHKVKVDSINNGKVSVSLAKLNAEQYVTYRSTLEQIDSHAARAYAEVCYRLRCLEERVAAGIEDKKKCRDEIKSYKQQKSRLSSQMPRYSAIRNVMEGVSFNAPQELDTTGQGNGAVRSATAELDLDALNGAPLSPGFYLISVTNQAAPNVRAALRELKLDETLFDIENWYAVQVTDLHYSRTDKALLVNKISDGSLPVAGQLLNITDGKSKLIAELKDGVVVMPSIEPSRRRTPRLMLQSGEDFISFTHYGNSANMQTSRRIMVVKDRSMYRPGETVHLRGVLREVSAKGEPTMPHVKSVQVTVSRPNRKELINKTVKLNAYGAFDFDFDLPKGDEDIVGTYRVSIQADGNKYRDEEFVECQEFRRDAFTTKTELKIDPVRPEEFTFTISAEDLNGVPLSGARAEVDMELSYNSPNNEEHKMCNVRPHLKSESKEETLTLDAEGKATYTGKIDYLHRDALMSGDAFLHISGSVTNDREEVKQFDGQHAHIAPADFSIHWYGDELKLYPNTEDEAQSGDKVLGREQTVSLRVWYNKPNEKVLPNGIIIVTHEPTMLWEESITVPANCVNGYKTNILERLQKEEGNDNRFVLEWRGKDTAGREFIDTDVVHSWDLRRPQRGALEGCHSTCKLNERTMQLSATFENEGRAAVVVNSVNGARSAGIVEVKKGDNTWDIPLLDDEFGKIEMAVLLPVQQDSHYVNLEYTSNNVEAERLQNKLGVELVMPQSTPRPGDAITLSGRILGPDGQPYPTTQVTLFAVDEGMLSVSGGHRVDNPGTFFTSVWVQRFYPQNSGADMYMRTPAGKQLRSSMLAGIWQGDIVGPGAALNVRNYGGGRLYGAVKSKKMKARNAAMDYEEGYDEEIMEYAAPVACESAAMDAASAPQAMMTGGLRSGSGEADDYCMARNAVRTQALAQVDNTWSVPQAPAVPEPRLRTNFVPVAVWAPAIDVDAEGKFMVDVKLPDTLTTYKVYAVALGEDGKCFGYAENKFTVNQPVMLTPGTPLFMSVGDRLRLPLTITNNTDTDGTWTVKLEGADAPQQVTLKAKSTSTLYFDYTAAEEGERKLHWEALAACGSDAVEGTFEVKFPAPVLREAHRLVLQEGAEPLKVATLPAPELATSTRGQVEIQLSANPLLHLNECMELVLKQGYGNTEWYASSLLPWMLHERMAPFSPVMASVPAAEAREVVLKGIDRLVKCQQADGGMSFWPGGDYCSCRESSPWVSAYVGLVLTIAADNGYVLPEQTLPRLREFLKKYIEKQRKDEELWESVSSHLLYAAGRTLEDDALITEGLKRELALQTERDGGYGVVSGVITPRGGYYAWFRSHRATASLNFLAEMHKDKEARHASFLKWMRVVGHDYRHATTWDGGWMLIALHEYLRLTPAGNAQSVVTLENGQKLTLGNGITEFTTAKTATLGELPTTITRNSGTAYVSVKFKAQPEQTEYPGVTEKGLQITRTYEKRGEDGAWRPATEFNVGDVVRVTLTCAKAEKDLEYFVLEDYLPSNMEAINPKVRSQAAGLEWQPWSHWFDNREFQAHRVRGFCTRWAGRDLLNMSYYARVKRAGEAMAPPASGQLMYEPQTYGLSPNTKVISR